MLKFLKSRRSWEPLSDIDDIEWEPLTQLAEEPKPIPIPIPTPTPTLRAVHRIPDDILLHIFAMNNNMDDDAPIAQAVYVPLRAIECLRSASQVNHAWRTAALNAHSLWANTIDADFLLSLGSTEWMKEVLARTGDAPLTVRWHPVRPNKAELMRAFFEENWARVRKLELFATSPNICRSNTLRDRDVTGTSLNTPPVGWRAEENLRLFEFFFRPAPLLESLVCGFPVRREDLLNHQHEQDLSGVPFSSHAPRLKEFNCNLSFDCGPLSWIPASVQRLILDSGSQPTNLKASELIDMVCNPTLNNLQKLVVRRQLVSSKDRKAEDVNMENVTACRNSLSRVRHMEITGNQQLGDVLGFLGDINLDFDYLRTLILSASIYSPETLAKSSLSVLAMYLSRCCSSLSPSSLVISANLHSLNIVYNITPCRSNNPFALGNTTFELRVGSSRPPKKDDSVGPMSSFLLKYLLYGVESISVLDATLYLSPAVFDPLDEGFVQFIRSFALVETLRASGETLSLLNSVMASSEAAIMPHLHTLILSDICTVDFVVLERFLNLRDMRGLAIKIFQCTLPMVDSEAENKMMSELSFLDEFENLQVRYTYGQRVVLDKM